MAPTTSSIEITELTTYSPQDLPPLQQLMRQLSQRLDLTEERLQAVVESKHTYLYVARVREESAAQEPSAAEAEGLGRIVGCASLCVFEAPSALRASVEDVVVLEAYRGQGIGRKLVERAIEAARQLAPIEVQLTSAPKRVAANALYSQMGFEPKHTNVYRMEINIENDNENDN